MSVLVQVISDNAGRETLAHAIERRRDEIRRAWLERVRADLSGRDVDAAELVDHADGYIDRLTQLLRGGSPVERIGARAWTDIARKYALTGIRLGFDIEQLVREMSQLRSVVAAVLASEGLSSELLHTVLDEAIAASAAEFAHVAHARLRAAEERYQLLVEGAREYAIFLLDAHGRVASWNSGAKRIKGYDESEILGQPYDVFFLPEDRASGEPSRLLAEARVKGEHKGRHRRLRKDGSEFWADVTLTALFDDSGVLRGFSKITRDATAQVEAEAAAMQRERLSAILESAVDAIIATDSSGRVALFNRAAERAFGCTAADAVGRSIEVFLPDARFPSISQECSASRPLPGLVSEGGMFCTLGARRAGGEVFPVEVTFAPTEIGGAPYYAAIVRDISARVRAERARREAEARLEEIADNTSAFIYIKDREGRFLLVNRAIETLFGLTRAQMLGKTDAEMFPSDQATKFRENDLEVLARGTAITVEEMVPVDGGLRTYLSVKFPLRDEDGEIYATGGVSTDVTEQVEARDALTREVQIRELFVGVLAHDLRNPLNAIIMTSAALLAARGLDPPAAKNVERIANGARRIAGLVDVLLDFTRVRSGAGIELQLRAADFHEICRHVVEEAVAAHPSRRIDCALEGDPAGEWDAVRIAQVASNLISNALAHGRVDAPVSVHVRGTPSEITLEVRNANAGAPLAPEQIERIFDPFTRGPRADGGGLGLGLFIVDQAVRAHGGSVRVESDVERGTAFVVTLPRHPRV
ncbi:Hypothetical protein I5071_57700 [Sandaracinus amylolyticus]|nr:Hypothetical protein I5071_57700 [Sandaracinus amylolyticus]